jgi:rod shape-determining protein MreB
MEDLPPEVAGDVLNRGITLTGGTALLARMQRRMEQDLRLAVRIAENPLQAVVLGMGRFFDEARLFRDVVRREDISMYREFRTVTEYQ